MLSLFYREGRLPLKFLWSSGRIVGVYLDDLTEPIFADDEYHCLQCGIGLYKIHWLRKRFCSLDCEVQFFRNHKNRGEGLWRNFRERVYLRDEKICVKCGKNLEGQTNYICDHIIPLFKGGKDWWEDYHMTNFQTLCPECNAIKTGFDFTIPTTAKENAKIVSLGWIFEKPVDYQLEKFLSINTKGNAVNSA